MRSIQDGARLVAVLVFTPMFAIPLTAAELPVVGVLGNSAGLSNRPVPYAYYTGIAADESGRLYLAGASEGIPVCDQDGACLAVLPLPDAEGMVAQSVMARAGDAIFLVASQPGQARSALYRIRTAGENAAALKCERITAGDGAWALSPTLDPKGRVIVGQSDVSKLQYTVAAFDAVSGQPASLFTTEEPKGATRPWRHTIQVEPEGTISVTHLGGVNWSARYNAAGERAGEALGGQIVDDFRYHFGYSGGVRRMDLTDQQPQPGDCGAGAPEIRMPGQMVRVGERYFFAGRGGALEAKWNGTNFEYVRRIGAVRIEDLVSDGTILRGVAFTADGNQDVQHVLELSKTKPVGQLLDVGTPLYGKRALAVAPALHGLVVVYQTGRKISVLYDGPAHLRYDLDLPEVKAAGQAAALDSDLLLADPESGVIWRRPLLDKEAPVAVWRADLPGVVGLAVAPDALYVATTNQVRRLSPDGTRVEWESSETYRGIRRLAATPDHVYVCDTTGQVVDQLDALTGRRQARLGVPGEPGQAPDRLDGPHAVAADANGLYIADNGNGRVLVATTTLWRPDIPKLPREDTSPIVATTLRVKPPRSGRMSVNVYDESGLTVRQLVCGDEVEKPGWFRSIPVTWDGKDLYGKYAEPGEYTYHGIISPKFELRYVMSIGQSGNPPYRSADGKGSWGGVWGNVMDICPVTLDPDSDIVVLWAFEEGEGGLIRMSQDGEVRWKQHLDWWMKANQMAVASDGQSVYVVGASAMNSPEGQEKYGGDLRRPLLWRVDAESGAKRFYAKEQPDQPMFGEYLQGDRIVTDLAVRDGKLYLTAPAQNKLFVADAETGRQVSAWTIENASGVAFDGQGRSLVGSGSKILVLDSAGKATSTFADAAGPVWGLFARPDGGVVASVGGDRQQVVFLDAQGKEVRALGKPGGRPRAGQMQTENFLDPVGLCVTGNGRLFVAENAAPKRFTCWSADGRFEREFHGPYYFSGMFGVDDEHPEDVYADTHADLIRYRVDYETGKWFVDHYWIGAYEQSGVPIKWWPRIRHRDGKTYWCSGSGGIAELMDDRARGVAAVYGGWVEKLPDGTYQPLFHTKKTDLKATWSDLNGDGQKQPEEWQVTEQPAYPITGSGPQQGWGSYFDEQFDLYMHDWSDRDEGGVWKIPVSEWKNGVPVYRWEEAQQVGLPRGHGLAHGASGARTAFAHAGGVYGFNGGYNAAGLPGVGHGHDWEFAQITQYDEKTGRPLWHASQRADGFVAPGEMYCPTGASGVINDYLFWTDENSLVHVWDVQRGLYVDTVLEDISRGPPPSPYTVWVELFNTRVFRHPRSGKVYLMAGSDAIHVFEVLGTEQKMARFSGKFTLTRAGIEEARLKEASRTVATRRTLAVRPAPGPVRVDGDLAEFATAQAAAMNLTGAAQGTARLLRDDRFLYVSFDVRDDSPWKNAGGDVTALFKTGDTVSLWLGPSAGPRAPGVGDARFLFAPDGDTARVMVYRPKVASGAQPVTFRSPSGQVALDRVQELADVPVAVKVDAQGYRLEAAIPWSATGLTPESESFGLDLSINFSDPAGQRNVARLHWARNGAAIVYDLPSEARFEPETWGTARK